MRLRTYLATRLLASSVLVLLVALLATAASAQRSTERELRATTRSIERVLVLQLAGFVESAGMQPRFLDWDALVPLARPDGSCLRVYAIDGRLLRGECRGGRATAVPGWYRGLHLALFGPLSASDVRLQPPAPRPSFELVPAADAAAVAAWQRLRTLLGPLVALVVVSSASAWWCARRAVRPAAAIRAALGALADGRPAPLPVPSGIREFDDIAQSGAALAQALAAAEAARARLSRRLLEVQEGERAALARDLHDEFAQHLTAVQAHAAALRLRHGTPVAQPIEDSARHLLGLLRTVLARLRPWAEGEMDLAEALRSLAREMPDGGPQVTLEIAGALDELPDALAVTLYRIAQEGITNALRHAGASHVDVRVTRGASAVTLTITDDGRGFDEAEAGAGHGLAGMRERAAACAGKVQVASAPGAGVRVEATLPLAPDAP